MKIHKICDATKIKWPIGLESGIFYRGYGPFMPHRFHNRCELTHTVVTILGYSFFNKHEKLILCTIVAKMLNDNNMLETWTCCNSLSVICGIGKPTVIKTITSLRERGYILIKTFEDLNEDEPTLFFQIGKKLFFSETFEKDGRSTCKRRPKDE